MGKIIKFESSDKELHKTAIEIRIKVFVDEQKVPIEIEEEFEEESTHFLIYYRRKVAGTARYRRTERGIKFERFALLKEYRGKGLGYDILRYMLNDVKPFSQSIYLNAQITAVDFYKRSGFIITGEKFIEGGIIHYPMIYEEPNRLENALEKAICRR